MRKNLTYDLGSKFPPRVNMILLDLFVGMWLASSRLLVMRSS